MIMQVLRTDETRHSTTKIHLKNCVNAPPHVLWSLACQTRPLLAVGRGRDA